MARTYTTAKTQEAFHGQFECRHCELDVGAVVHASGSGAVEGRIADGAGESAYKEAEDDANNVAARTLQFVKCPRCGKRDPGGRTYRIQMTILAIVGGAILSGLACGLAALRMKPHGDWFYFWAGFAVLIGGGLYWRFRRPWVDADGRTKFDASYASGNTTPS